MSDKRGAMNKPWEYKQVKLQESLSYWKMPPLDGWNIVGMNHYNANDEKQLFVAMSKNGKLIKEEGKDDEYLWNRLWHKANDLLND